MQNLEGYTVSVESATTTRVIDISVTGKDPAQVAQVANTLASTLSDVAQDVMGVSSVNVVEYAETPDKPSGPKRLMYTGVAFLAGLAVGFFQSREELLHLVRVDKTFCPAISTEEREASLKGWHRAVRASRAFTDEEQ